MEKVEVSQEAIFVFFFWGQVICRNMKEQSKFKKVWRDHMPTFSVCMIVCDINILDFRWKKKKLYGVVGQT